MEGRPTIFALSSGALPAAIAIIRISGPAAFAAAAALGAGTLEPRMAALRRLTDPATGAMLDRAMCLGFPGPASATGEDVVELHIHGSRAVAAAVLSALGALPGCTMAQPGEFTRRGLLAGKLDLPSTEALGDLLSADTEAQRRQAIRNAEGGLSRLVDEWRLRLLRLAAMIEAAIDYAEEGDVTHVEEQIDQQLASAIADIDIVLGAPPAERLRDGFRVVIAGPPNAGKSSLFNAILGRGAAIVSPYAGTTRDVIEAPIVLDGFPILLIDTAGDRDAQDPVEAIGVERGQAVRSEADIVLWMGEHGAAPTHSITLSGKADVVAAPADALGVSTVTGQGLSILRAMLVDRCRLASPPEDQPAWNSRQRALLADCRLALSATQSAQAIELKAEEIRRALAALDRITGSADVEAMLDQLFERFCLGK